MSGLRLRQVRDDADGRVPARVSMRVLRNGLEAVAWRLLCVLLVRRSALSAKADRSAQLASRVASSRLPFRSNVRREISRTRISWAAVPAPRARTSTLPRRRGRLNVQPSMPRVADALVNPSACAALAPRMTLLRSAADASYVIARGLIAIRRPCVAASPAPASLTPRSAPPPSTRRRSPTRAKSSARSGPRPASRSRVGLELTTLRSDSDTTRASLTRAATRG